MKTRHCVQTIMAHCCVMLGTNDWRNKDEYKKKTGKEELHFHQFPVDKKRRKELSTANLLNSYATLNQHCLQP